MSLKGYINERASFYKDLSNMLDNAYLPLTKNVSKILGGGTQQDVFHTTSLDFLPGIKKIKGAKSISTFTKGLNSVIQNVNVKPDVLVKISGNTVLQSDKDAFTHVDKSGMRWINLRTLQDNRKKYNFILDAFIGKTIKYMNDKYNMNIEDEMIQDHLEKLKPKEQKDVVDFYIKHVESLLTNNMYLDIIKEFLTDNKTKYTHDEIVVNKFKVIGVYSIEAGKFQYDKSMAQFTIEKMGYKYLGHISKDDFNKVTPQTF